LGQGLLLISNGTDAYLLEECRELQAQMSIVSQQYRIAISSVMDIGAHVGFFGLHMAALGCRTILVEASSYSYVMLMENIKSNNLTINTVALCAAVSVDNKIIDLYGQDNCAGGISIYSGNITPNVCGYTVSVTLPQLLSKWPSEIVKMDIEGAEHAILPNYHWVF
jgi:FkbM family methyltransferase